LAACLVGSNGFISVCWKALTNQQISYLSVIISLKSDRQNLSLLYFVNRIALSIVLAALFCSGKSSAQSVEYERQKELKIASPSPFEAIISQDEKREIVYQNEWVVAFVPIRKQAPVHLLIVPRKRIYTLNDVGEADAVILSHLLLAAKELARKYTIDKTGYRVAINTNEHAGQSVFHIHMHLLGGMKLGPMVSESYKE
jgi:histidine triad (HIT) family protein